MEGDRRMERGEGEQEIEDEGSGREDLLGKEQRGSAWKEILEKWSHCGVS